jgi:competence protein ComEC
VTGWTLPVAAGAFWTGLLGWSRHPPWLRPWMGLAIGASAFCSAWLASPGMARDSIVLDRLGVREPGPMTAIGPGRMGRRSGGSFVAGLATLGLVALGTGWGGLAEARVAGALPARLAPEHVTVVGTLKTDPRPGGYGWSAVVDLSRIEWDGRAVTLRSAVWVTGDGDVPRVMRGDLVHLEGSLRLPEEPEFAWALRRRGIPAALAVDDLVRLGPSPSRFIRGTQAVRRLVGRSIGRIFAPREAGLLLGLALGDDSELDPGVARDFQAAGLGHLLVVSGGNVAMVLAPLLAAAAVLRFGRRTRFLVGVGTVAFFTVLTGGEPSVLRAGVMATLTLLGVVLGRPRSAASVLAGAVLVLLVLDPWLVWSVGFQLSVGATAGMVAMAAPFAKRLRFLPGPVALAAGATLAAQLGVSPILLFHFDEVPLVSVPANLAAFPAVSPALLLGIAASVLGLVWGGLGAAAGVVASLPLRYLEWLADRAAKAPLPAVTSDGGVVDLAIGATLVVTIAWWVRSDRQLPREIAAVFVLLVPLVVWSTAIRAGPPAGVRITFFDVGQGDAALIESPAGARVLVDGGPDQVQVATELAALGVRRLDLVVASHPHADHIVGLPAVLTRLPVGLLVQPGCDSEPPLQRILDRAIAAEDVPVQTARAGDTLTVGDLRFDVLSPDRCWTGTESDANNDALVLMLTYAGHRVLFATEPEEPAQQVMLTNGLSLDADVLHVPHHGAATSLPEYFQAVDAEEAIVSVGPNEYGHPVPATLAALEATGAELWRTDEHGDIVVTFGSSGPVVTVER